MDAHELQQLHTLITNKLPPHLKLHSCHHTLVTDGEHTVSIGNTTNNILYTAMTPARHYSDHSVQQVILSHTKTTLYIQNNKLTLVSLCLLVCSSCAH